MSRWQKLLDESYRTLSDLKEPLGLSDERYAELAPFEERYPVLVTSYYLRLMNKLDADDPIKKMIVPDLTLPAAIDAKAQENTESVIQGGQHKYQKSVLIISNNHALGYARHCYRRDFARLDEDEASLRIPKLAEYIGDHPEIDNISVSGGDAFLNSNDRIGEYLKAFAFLPNVDYIRFTTSVPANLPAAHHRGRRRAAEAPVALREGKGHHHRHAVQPSARDHRGRLHRGAPAARGGLHGAQRGRAAARRER